MVLLPVSRSNDTTRSRKGATLQPSASDVKTISPSVSRDGGLTTDVRAFQSGAGSAATELSPAINTRAEQLRKVAEKQQTREETVAKARAKREYNEAVRAELQRIEVEEDPSDSAVMEAFGAFSAQRKAEIQGKLSLSPDAAADLSISLDDDESEFIGKASGISVAAGKAVVNNSRQTDVNRLLSMAEGNPTEENINALLLKSTDTENSYNRVYTEEEQINNLNETRQNIALTGLNTLFAKGKLEDAEKLISNPTILAAVEPKTLIQVKNRLSTAFVERKNELERKRLEAQSPIGKIRRDEAAGIISPEDADAAIEKATFIAKQDLNTPGKIVSASSLNPELPEYFDDVFLIQQPSGKLDVLKGENGEGGKVSFSKQEQDDGTVAVFKQEGNEPPEFVKLLTGSDGKPIRTGVSQRGDNIDKRADVTAKLRERSLDLTAGRLENTIKQNVRTSEATLRDDYDRRTEPFREQLKSINELDIALANDISGLDNKIITNLVSRAIAPTNVRAQAELDSFKGFGDLGERVSGAISTFFSGVRTEAQLDQVRTLVKEMRDKHISPAIDELGKAYTGVAIRSELDPDNVVITGVKEEVVKVKTVKEAKELPKGTRFIDPDGVERIR